MTSTIARTATGAGSRPTSTKIENNFSHFRFRKRQTISTSTILVSGKGAFKKDDTAIDGKGFCDDSAKAMVPKNLDDVAWGRKNSKIV